jgi:hypothetical protein
MLTLARNVLTSVHVLIVGVALAPAAEPGWLWQIGTADKDNREFALAPGNFAKYQDDGFFVIGQSDPKRDWPYVHPGPVDHWAGSREHTFTIAFAVKAAPPQGDCRLRLDLVDTQRAAPPRLAIHVNGKAFERALPPGAGDESVNGRPAAGKSHRLELAFPSSLLKAGSNQIDITTLNGSWLLYDAISLAAPAGTELAPMTDADIVTFPPPADFPVLVRLGDRLCQVVRVKIRHLGDDADAVMQAGAVRMQARVRRGDNSIEFPLPAVDKEQPVDVCVTVAGKRVAEQSLLLTPVRRWVVYLLPHSHVDIGYTEVQTDVEKKQISNLRRAMELAKASADYPEGARFKWNVEVMWPVESYLRQAKPQEREALLKAIRSGDVGLEALYGNLLTGLCRPEELMRSVEYALRVAKMAGVPLESAMISDVPGYTWSTMSVFAHAGVKYFSFAPNFFDRIGYTMALWQDKPFYWKTPDGRGKVLCWCPKTGYALGHVIGDGPAFTKFLPGYVKELAQKGYPYDIACLRWNVHGDNGTPDEKIAAAIKEWNTKYAYPKVVITTTAAAFRDFEQRYGDKLPVLAGDYTPFWEDGAGSSARETAMNRDSAERLVQAEALWSLRRLGAFPADDFYNAWRNVLLYSEHTWGAYNSIGQPDVPFVKAQWKIKQAFALDADVQSRKLMAAATASQQPSDKPVTAIDVYNTCSWTRTDLVVAPKGLQLAGDCVEDSAGNAVPSQRLSTGELALLAADVPALAAKRFVIKQGTATAAGKTAAQGNSLSNADLTVRLDEKTGGITGLQSRGLGVDLVDAKAATAINDYFYLPGANLKDLQRNGPAKITVKEAGPLVASLVAECDAPGCNRLTREVRLFAGLDRVDLINVVDKKPVRAKEGVHFGYGFNVPKGQVRMDVGWAVVRPNEDQIPAACKNWFSVQRWVDISNAEYGVTWVPIDAPLVQLGGITANLIGSQTDPKPWMTVVPPTQTLYSWAMNNHWHTNYRAEQEGPTTFRFSIRPHKAFDQAAAYRFGVEQSQPLVAIAAGNAPAPAAPRLTLGTDAVMVTLLQPGEGPSLVVRLFNTSGQTQEVKLNWAGPAPKSVEMTDLTGRPGKKIDGPLSMAPMEIVTLRATME